MEKLDAERPRYDRQRRDIAAEPECEEVTHLAVTILGWHITDRVFFDQLGSFTVRGGQDAVSCLAQLRCDISAAQAWPERARCLRSSIRITRRAGSRGDRPVASTSHRTLRVVRL